ncbi:Proline and serine-rich protein 2 [Oryzias melastigma]|uniref:Proline and serine-rich protein 2 n=1 Tax=Oryzias melastigma TaxID=30732 RepID=A0A834C8U3_ORYME|nr:proteoglycan 4 [Oryzias melastigma]XP_024145517.1 proteoglycan 4 [Oryzias melastigma]KAF6723309.1 Proline and serine-rich protein 2 [Oryzias melastigma]
MDVRLHGNSQFHHRVNGGARRSSRSEKDDTLKYLSPEEKETLQFFEQTIESLDDSLEDQENRRSGQIKHQENSHTPICVVDGHSIPNPSPHQDIIDLVHPEPDLMPHKETLFNPNNPDFQRMIPPPESHFEVKPRHESMALEYSLPAPNTPPDGQFAYHPPGSVPTPVLIAQKLAENQGGGTTNFHPSTFLRRLSLETEKPLVENSDHSSRYGPPTSTKPSHLPANISMMLGGKEHPKPSGSDENIYNRQEPIHASPSVTPPFSPSEHHRQSTEQKVRKAPTRSISFKDPTPDKSRREALSKLGLTRNRAMSGGKSVENKLHIKPMEPLKVTAPSTKTADTSVPQTTPNNLPEPAKTTPNYTDADRKPETLPTHLHRIHDTRSAYLTPSSPSIAQTRPNPAPVENKLHIKPMEPLKVTAPNTKTVDTSVPQTTPSNLPEPARTTPNYTNVDRKSETLPTHLHRIHDTRGAHLTPSSPSVTQNRPSPAPVENTTPHSPPSEITSLSFNHFGGKSIVVHPTAPSRNDPSTSPITSEPKIPLPVLSNPPEANLYGGKTKVMNPVSTNRTDLPDILSPLFPQNPPAPARPEPAAAELNRYGGKSLTINPAAGGNRSTVSPARSVKGPPPTPAPRPARQSYHGPLSPPKPAPTERRRSNSMFRPQGITVQFSGRGPMNDSRREALRKLGLLKT